METPTYGGVWTPGVDSLGLRSFWSNMLGVMHHFVAMFVSAAPEPEPEPEPVPDAAVVV